MHGFHGMLDDDSWTVRRRASGSVGYRMFFNIVVASCAITFVVAWFLKIDSDFGKKHEE